MARIDSLLDLVARQGANELRLGADREPLMFADGAAKRLTMPKTSMETLRDLLGDLLGAERERLLAEQGHIAFTHEAPAGSFRVTMNRKSAPDAPLAFDAIFLRGKGAATPTREVAPSLREKPRAMAHEPSPPTEPSTRAPVAQVPSAASLVATATPALTALVQRALGLRASDVHLAEGEAPVARIDSALRPLDSEPTQDLTTLLGAPLLEEAERRLGLGISADLALTIEGVGRCRLNVFRASHGRAAALRILRGAPPSLAELAAPIALEELVELPHGLVLVCGATGSGKSTTLAALARRALERRPSMLVTLEDPIEYELTSSVGRVRQRQVGRDVKDFATGLRDALRQDPDILLIGEMRDPETIGLALTAAETGHLVLASLHSRSAVSAIERIVDTYAPERQAQIRVQLADSLRAVVAQRLVPRADGEGRVLALEMLRGTHAVANAIREARTGGLQSAMQAGKKEAMLPLERCLADLVQKRKITAEAARASANDLSALVQYMTAL